ncbi:cell division protein FtsL [Glaciecola siphonariae]|uniref:Cell division protein FtsL n=1 Tax=Glaciecola siphonariae TaxID=521012 RepID=A0ABV9LWR4_9ALTE
MSKPTANFNLLLIIATDLGRHLFIILLYFSVIGSALAVVVSTHKNRQLIIAQEQLVQQKDALDIEWRHLIIEETALTEHNRIERLVEEKLNMRRPTQADEKLVRVKP